MIHKLGIDLDGVVEKGTVSAKIPISKSSGTIYI